MSALDPEETTFQDPETCIQYRVVGDDKVDQLLPGEGQEWTRHETYELFADSPEPLAEFAAFQEAVVNPAAPDAFLRLSEEQQQIAKTLVLGELPDLDAGGQGHGRRSWGALRDQYAHLYMDELHQLARDNAIASAALEKTFLALGARSRHSARRPTGRARARRESLARQTLDPVRRAPGDESAKYTPAHIAEEPGRRPRRDDFPTWEMAPTLLLEFATWSSSATGCRRLVRTRRRRAGARRGVWRQMPSWT